ncbi:MAG: hypothetical protein ACKVS6_09455 [Planctomycetota bacterium]
MNPITKKKTFDCIEMKDRIQKQIYDEIKDLSPAGQREYFRKGAEEGPLAEWVKKVKQAAGKK